MKQRNKIINLTISLLLSMLLVVGAVFAASILSRPPTVKENIKLGNKYLSSLDYDKAIAEYQTALVTEPTNNQALTGLAKAYEQTGQARLALEVISTQSSKYINPVLEELRLDIYIDRGELQKAIILADKIAEQTDNPEIIKTRDELLNRLLSRSASYGEAATHAAYIDSGKLFASGQNIAGQLGTSNGIYDHAYTQPPEKDTSLPDIPHSVFCTNSNTFVVTAAGEVYAAGGNKTSIMGTGEYDLQTLSGWRKLNTPSDIARISGDDISAIYLNTSGEAFVSGFFDNAAHKQPQKVAGFGRIMQIESANNTYYTLSTQGRLSFVSNAPNQDFSGQSSSIAENIVMFSLDKDTLALYYLTFDNKICAPNGFNFPVPFKTIDGTAYDPEFEIKSMISTSDSLLILKSDNTLVQYNNAGEAIITVPQGKVPQQLYLSNKVGVVQFEDGSFMPITL